MRQETGSIPGRFNLVNNDLTLTLMDVEALALGGSTIGSYVSLGVLEHFHYGMEKSLAEAWRVLKPGGLIFISVPHFNALRRFLARSGRFERVPPDQVAVERFYQYALSAGQLREILEKNRFECLEESYFSVIKGLRDELRWLKRLYRFYQELLGRSTLHRIPAKMVSLLLRLIEKTAELPFLKKRCSHIVMVVAKKSPDPVPTSQPEAP